MTILSHLQTLLDLFCYHASNRKLTQPSVCRRVQTEMPMPRDTNIKLLKITEAHKQVNTEHCVLLSLEANILFRCMSLSFSLFSPPSPHTHVLTLLLCNLLDH